MAKSSLTPFIGTAGWTLPPGCREFFPGDGSHLERYARILNAVEINSSFYRDHKPQSYRKWSESVPDDFRFSVKLSRALTHEKQLAEAGDSLCRVLDGIAHLGSKWRMLLVQLPPSLQFAEKRIESFLTGLRKLYSGSVAWEPRHPTWASAKAVELLAAFNVNKVLADPEPCPLPKLARAAVEGELYYRLHGTPEMYKSKYAPDRIASLSERLREASQIKKTVWCIFDNTMFGHATENALELRGAEPSALVDS